MDGKSLDVTAELVAQLKAILPDVFSEDKIDFQRLKQALGEDTFVQGEHYELSWAGKTEARKEIQKQTTATLAPNRAASIDFDNANHIFIEGENLEVLRTLQKAYFGKVKMIYIDPPYNTGSDSFVYPDDYTERQDEYKKRTGLTNGDGYLNKQDLWKKNVKENGQFHSVWLSMMYPRLYLSRNLLKEDGAIIMHIDENEKTNLELVLNEIYGEENNLGLIIWDKGNPKGDARGIANQHEYLLVFAKNKEQFINSNPLVRKKRNAEKILRKAEALFKKIGTTSLPNGLNEVAKAYNLPTEITSKFIKKITLEDVNEEFYKWVKKQDDFSGGELAYDMIDEKGDVYQSVSMAWPNKKKAPDDYFIPLIHPLTKKPCPVPERGWRFPSDTLSKMLKDKCIIFGEDETTQPRKKYTLKNNLTENLPSVLFYGGSDDKLFKEMNLSFENPKPTEFAKQLISVFVNNDYDLILDFFAGSGTTAQAVLELNEEDNGNRRFVCVQMPEKTEEGNEAHKAGYKTIADITQARIKKVIEKIEKQRAAKAAKQKGELFNGKNDNPQYPLGFQSYKLATSNFKQWNKYVTGEEALLEQLDIFQQAEKENNLPENMLYELLIKGGFDLTTKIVKLPVGAFNVDNGKLWMYFDAYTNDLKTAILAAKPARLICLDSCFGGDDVAITNLQLELREESIDLTII